MRDDGNVTNLIHSATMSVGQPASVDGHSRVIAVSARPTISVRNMPQPYLASSAGRRNARPVVMRTAGPSQRVRRLSVVRNGRGSRLCDGDASPNVPESKPNKPDRRSSPAHGYNKAGHLLRYSQ